MLLSRNLEPTSVMLGPHTFLTLRELNWVAAKTYADEVRRLRGWPSAQECLCPWLWEIARRYWQGYFQSQAKQPLDLRRNAPGRFSG